MCIRDRRKDEEALQIAIAMAEDEKRYPVPQIIACLLYTSDLHFLVESTLLGQVADIAYIFVGHLLTVEQYGTAVG